MLQNTNEKDLLIEDILSNIEFRFIDQRTLWSVSFSFEPKDNICELDLANTQILEQRNPLMNIDFLSIPRLSTISIGYIINRLVRNMPSDQMYVNIGTWCGFSFFAGLLGNNNKLCCGVDNFSAEIVQLESGVSKNVFTQYYKLFQTPRSVFYEMDYELYFKNIHQGMIGVYFCDGDHSRTHTLNALAQAEPRLICNAYILIDDTNDKDVREVVMGFVSRSKETYTVVLDEKTPNMGHPTFWNGLLIFKKIS